LWTVASIGAAGLVVGASLATTSPTTQAAEISCFLNKVNHTAEVLIGVHREEYETLFNCEDACENEIIPQMETSIRESYNAVSAQCDDVAQRIILEVTYDSIKSSEATMAGLVSASEYIVSYWTVTMQCNQRCPDDGYMFGSVFNDAQRRTLDDLEDLSRILRPSDLDSLGKQIEEEPRQAPSMVSNIHSPKFTFVVSFIFSLSFALSSILTKCTEHSVHFSFFVFIGIYDGVGTNCIYTSISEYCPECEFWSIRTIDC
jgi:hypothetical protein